MKGISKGANIVGTYSERSRIKFDVTGQKNKKSYEKVGASAKESSARLR